MKKLIDKKIVLTILMQISVAYPAYANRQAEAASRLFSIVEEENRASQAQRSPSVSSTRSSAPAASTRSQTRQSNTRSNRAARCDFGMYTLSEVQAILSEHGFYTSTIDGIWGRQTENAINLARELLRLPSGNTCLEETEIKNLEDLLATDDIVTTEIVASDDVVTTEKDTNADIQNERLDYVGGESRNNLMLRESAIVLVGDLEKFISRGGVGFDLTLPMRFAEVRDVSEEIWSEELSAKLDSFRDYLLENEDFVVFRLQQEQERSEQYRQDVQKSQDTISASLTIVRTWVAANLLDERAVLASQTLLQADEAIASNNLQELLAVQKEVEETVLIIGARIMPAEQLEIMPAFDVTSTFIFGNFSGDAPNIYRNLEGETEFGNQKAVLCEFGDLDEWTSYEVASFLKSLFVLENISKAPSDCRDSPDLIVFAGAALASEQDLLTDNSLGLELISEITRAQVMQSRQRLEITSQLMEDDILKGARTGYGLVTFDTNNRRICLIVDESSDEHVSALGAMNDIIQLFYSSQISFAISSDPLEAFRRIQSRQCGGVYGDEETLHTLLRAFKNNTMSYRLVPFWIHQAVIEEIIEEKRKSEAKVLAFEQERLLTDDLRVAAMRDLAERAAVRQAELQNRNKIRFAALVSSLREVVSEAITFGFQYSPLDSDFEENLSNLTHASGENFPRSVYDELVGEATDLASYQWKLENIVLEGVDYGLMVFDGRELDGVIVEVNLELANRVLGQFRTHCQSIRAGLDRDFEMWRRVEVGKCGDGASSWKSSTNFESQWIVQTIRE